MVAAIWDENSGRMSQVYEKAMAKIKRKCPRVWGVISSWAEVYLKTVETGEDAPTSIHILYKPTAEDMKKGPLRYVKVRGSALHRMAQAETGLTDKDLTMAVADNLQMREKEEERISKMRIKAAHQKRWKLHYSRELKRQKEGQRRQTSDRCAA